MAQTLALFGRVVPEFTRKCTGRLGARWAIENVDATGGVFEDYSDDQIIDGPGA
jgi:hypothetical protein